MLDEGHVRLDQPGFGLVVAQAGTWIESTNEVHAEHHRFQGPAHGLGHFLVALVLQSVQMFRYQHDGIVECLQFGGMTAVDVLAIDALQALQLRQQTFPQIARPNSDRVHLAHQVNGFAQRITAKRDPGRHRPRGHEGGTGYLGFDFLTLRLTRQGLLLSYGHRGFCNFRLQVILGRQDGRRGFLRRVRAGCGQFPSLRIEAGRLFLIGQPQQLIVRCGQVAFLVQVPDHQFRRSIHVLVDVQRAQLPHQVVGEGSGLGKEILEGRLFTLFHLDRGAQAGIKVFREKRPEIDFVEGIFFLGGYGLVFLDGKGAVALHFLFAGRNLVEQGDRIVKFLKYRVLRQLSRDHVRQLKLVERQDADHLHQTRGQNLLLRNFEV